MIDIRRPPDAFALEPKTAAALVRAAAANCDITARVQECGFGSGWENWLRDQCVQWVPGGRITRIDARVMRYADGGGCDGVCPRNALSAVIGLSDSRSGGEVVVDGQTVALGVGEGLVLPCAGRLAVCPVTRGSRWLLVLTLALALAPGST